MGERFIPPLICHDIVRDGRLLIQRQDAITEIAELWPTPRARRISRERPTWHPWRPAIRLDSDKSPYAEFFRPVPAELRSFLGRFPTRQWELLSGVGRNQAVYDLLQANPALGWMSQLHWKFIPGAAVDMEHSVRLACRRHREIAADLGFPDRSWSARMLAKVPVESLSVRTLENLRRLAASGDGAKWLQHLPTLDRSLTTILSNHRLLEMTTGRLFKELAESGQTSAVARVALQLIEIGDFQTELGRSRRYQFRSVAEVAAAWKALKTSREGQYFRTPLASLQNPPESYRKLLHGAVLIPLETREAIAREGWEQRNCISSYTAAADAGKVYLFKLLHPERATVALKIRKDRWSVSELKGPRNRPVRRDTRLLVDRVLKAANGGTSLYAQAKWDQ